jgi:hypothetical protein
MTRNLSACREFLRFLAASPLLAGTQEPSAKDALSVLDFEPLAHKALPPAHWGYMSTGVDDDLTVRMNRRTSNSARYQRDTRGKGPKSLLHWHRYGVQNQRQGPSQKRAREEERQITARRLGGIAPPADLRHEGELHSAAIRTHLGHTDGRKWTITLRVVRLHSMESIPIPLLARPGHHSSAPRCRSTCPSALLWRHPFKQSQLTLSGNRPHRCQPVLVSLAAFLNLDSNRQFHAIDTAIRCASAR